MDQRRLGSGCTGTTWGVMVRATMNASLTPMNIGFGSYAEKAISSIA